MNLNDEPLAAAAAGMPTAAFNSEPGATTAVEPPVEPIPCVEPEPLLATVKEAGKLLRCGKSKVFDMLKVGQLERVKLGGATRVTMRSIHKRAGL